MSNQQKAINKEQLIIKILSSIKRCPENTFKLIDFCIFTEMTKAELKPVFKTMISEKLIFCVKDSYFITNAGIDAVDAAVSDARIVTSTKEWKDEALTGIYAKGGVSHESDIKNAVVPKGC